jgi:hypothetical protein
MIVRNDASARGRHGREAVDGYAAAIPISSRVTTGRSVKLMSMAIVPIVNAIYQFRAPRTMTILSLARLPLQRDGRFHC